MSEIVDMRPHVLVVDDNAQNREILEIYLEDMDVDVSEADCGERALQMLETCVYDLLLLDILMPGINGNDVLKAMKANPAWRGISVIMCSALNDNTTIVESLKLGAEDYVSKPFDRNVLEARVNGCLERKILRDRERKIKLQLQESQRLLQIELDDAAHYMRKLLPPELDAPIATHWIFQPCSKLGGDSFGYQWLNADTFAVYLLDVSGHGVGSALLSATITDWFRDITLHHVDFEQPKCVANALNHVFPMEQHANKYFSIWYGVYFRAENKLRYACCGHPPAILLSKDNIAHLSVGGPAVTGLYDDYEQGEVQVQHAERLLLFSDGIYEVPTQGEQMMGYHEFADIVKKLHDEEDWALERMVDYFQSDPSFDHFLDDVSLLQVTF